MAPRLSQHSTYSISSLGELPSHQRCAHSAYTYINFFFYLGDRSQISLFSSSSPHTHTPSDESPHLSSPHRHHHPLRCFFISLIFLKHSFTPPSVHVLDDEMMMRMGGNAPETHTHTRFEIHKRAIHSHFEKTINSSSSSSIHVYLHVNMRLQFSNPVIVWSSV